MRLFKTGDIHQKFGGSSMTKVEGRVVRINRPNQVVYTIFSDLTNFAANLPSDMLERSEVRVTPNTLVGKVQGFELGIEVLQRTPFEKIEYKHYGNSPIEFNIDVNMTYVSPSSCDFQFIVRANIPAMLKFMIVGKLQEAVDKITDQIEQATSAIP